jgi:hypothetical protein
MVAGEEIKMPEKIFITQIALFCIDPPQNEWK